MLYFISYILYFISINIGKRNDGTKIKLTGKTTEQKGTVKLQNNDNGSCSESKIKMTNEKTKSYLTSSKKIDEKDHTNVSSKTTASSSNAGSSGITKIPKPIERLPQSNVNSNSTTVKQKNPVFGQICNFFRKNGMILVIIIKQFFIIFLYKFIKLYILFTIFIYIISLEI